MTDEPELIAEPAVDDEGADAAATAGEGDTYRRLKSQPEVWAAMTLSERARAIFADVPQEAWDELPNDLSYQHDHYIYGTPKRPEPGTPEYEREGEALAAAELEPPVERFAYEEIPPEIWATMTFEEQTRAIVASIPQEVWDEIPDDASYQHDHYIYGWPKKP